VTEGRDLGPLATSDLAGRLGDGFELVLPTGESFEIRLAEVTEHPYLPQAAQRRRGFSAVFESDRPGRLPQAIYRVTHPELGALDLFLVPLGPRDGKMRYEAVFN
jgi:hypothetical protein